MNKNFNNLAVLVVDSPNNITYFLNYIYKFNFKKIILLKKQKTKIRKNLIKKFNLKILNFSSKEFTYNILKKNNVKSYLEEHFLILRTSKFANIDLFKLYKIFLKKKKKLIVTINKNNKKFENTEIFYMRKSMIENYDFDFKNLNRNLNYKINFINVEFLNIKKHHKINKIAQFFSSIYSKSIILDRDGVINVNKGYVGFKKDFKFQLGAIKAIKYLYKNNFNIFVVSNQSGIARGYFKLSDVEQLHNYLRNYIIKNKATINKIYFSPYHKDGIIKIYKKNSSCRKPGIKLFKLLVKEWNIKDKSKITMIGDQNSDQQFANNADINFSFFKRGNLYSLIKKLKIVNS